MNQENISAELADSSYRTFLVGINKKHESDFIQLTRIGLHLLTVYDGLKDEVLGYLCYVFDCCVEKHFTQKKDSAEILEDELILKEVQNVLCSFVRKNPETWSRTVGEWSLELLGVLSNKYANQMRTSSKATVTKKLQWWMNFQPIRTLVDIAIENLSHLTDSEVDDCVETLLDVGTEPRPHTDWVVAVIGSSFPKGVIPALLTYGLKEWGKHVHCNKTRKDRINFVARILAPLATSRPKDVQAASLALIKWSLELNRDVTEQKYRAVPFLLKLASRCRSFQHLLLSAVICFVTPATLSQLAEVAPHWLEYFDGAQQLLKLVADLILGSYTDGAKILFLLLDEACPLRGHSITSPSVKEKSKEILETVVEEADSRLRRCPLREGESVPLFLSVKAEINKFYPFLLTGNTLRAQKTVGIIALFGYNDHVVVVNAASYLLQEATTAEQLAVLVRLLTSTEQTAEQNILSQAVEKTLLLRGDHILRMLINLRIILDWEQTRKVPVLDRQLVRNAVAANLQLLVEMLKATCDVNCASVIITLLERVLLQPNSQKPDLSVQLILKLTLAVVKCTFLGYVEGKLMGGRQLLVLLCASCPSARTSATRELLETALFRTDVTPLFGAVPRVEEGTQEDVSLLQQLRQQATPTIPNSMFGTRVFGSMAQKPASVVPSDTIFRNTQHLIDTIKACSAVSPTDEHVLPEAMTAIARLLTELISPSVMYNGLMWPEAIVMKLMEYHDVKIWVMVKESPICWHLLKMIAVYRPALCYCSPLLRALTSMLMTQWRSVEGGALIPDLKDVTLRLLDLLVLGQLLPPPLSSVRDVVPHVEPSQVVRLLTDCVWAYFRDNPPSTEAFSHINNGHMWRDPSLPAPGSPYTDVLHSVMASNLSALGSLYGQLFVQH